eukprot:scaffold35859_cov72-Cyclotella_meneghiniana.AAC.5
MMDSYNPYINHGNQDRYPIIHTNEAELEECSSLEDCSTIVDEEAIANNDVNTSSGSWWADIARANDDGSVIENSRSANNGNAVRSRFTSLSRFVNGSSSGTKCLFFASVFVVLSSIGLACVGVGMMMKHADGFTYSFRGEVDSGASAALSVEQMTRITPGAAPVNTFAPTYVFATPNPISSETEEIPEIDEAWATEPTATTTAAESEEFDTMKVPDALFEFSMSMDFHDDFEYMSMDFEQFDAGLEIVTDEEEIVPEETAVDEEVVTEENADVIVLDETTAAPSTSIESTTAIDSATTVAATTPATQESLEGTELITNVLTPIADSFVESNSTKSFGPRKWLKVDGQPERISLIRFDVSSLTRNQAVKLVSAKLKLYALTSSPFGGRIDIVDSDNCGVWDEKTLTWFNAPPCVFANSSESIGSFGAAQEFSSIETDLTLDLLNLRTEITVKITSDKANGVTYASKENVTAAPELILEYMGTPYVTDMPTSTPTFNNKPFENRIELKKAIDTCFYGDDAATAATLVEYDLDACESKIKTTYGWPMNTWNTGLVDDMQLLFVGKRDFNEDISDWDTSRVTNLYETFSYAESFTGDISRWDVSKVWKMFGLFNGAKKFNSDISNWDTSSLKDMQWMFFETESFSGDLSKWDTSRVTNMHEVFYHCFQFNSDLSKWDTSRVTDMRYMFYEAPKFNSDISNWDVSKVVEFEQMFYGATSFNQDLSNWDLSSGKNIQHQ